ncbi:MAG: FAD-dependent oxidoreductase [Bosea sp. (in: a-proteobacteria)]|uniref:NAD(P)/FAD-dependent oxidoreductase n=1 Tax=Bosea sp. (in: a-proteobacteria) TaxID=1871050 RepID=UPI002733F409|nr:FAD-dependent oxidoreductase [Bosea sp. (in: a-proteobacteria)]MDP3255152.1 FAD-dependent oxidoreductase [Bosea sp. (in: a-proteobacteria)]MDP3318616.1 FAD-dependent oxidoreductase [Bosea sp. (in: a-proteobacteria)]
MPTAPSPPTTDTFDLLVIGASYAGLAIAAAAREAGFAGRIALAGDEAELPYQRPPLSKGFLLGRAGAHLPLKAASFFAEADIAFLPRRHAVTLDREARQVHFADGSVLGYGQLALATGARAAALRCEGAALDGVLALRSLDDAQALSARLAAARAIVIIGGGFIGLEVASAAIALGKQVTVVEAGPRLIGHAVAPEISAYIQGVHERQGVAIRLDTRIERIEGEGGKVAAVLCADGSRLACDLVLAAVGAVPNVEFAAAAGLAMEDGIAVDASGRTSDPLIFAAGDCTSHPNVHARRRLRLSSVQNANDQGRIVGATIAGRPEPHAAVPWFWSDQYDVKLQMVGLGVPGGPAVLRGSPSEGRFSLFRYDGPRLVAIESINRPADHMMGRRLIAAGLSPTPEQAGDPAFDLRSLA